MSTNTSSTLAAIQQCLVACRSRGKRRACSLTEDQCTRRVHCQWWGSSIQTIFSTANAHLQKEFLSENWSQSKVVGWDWTLWDCSRWHVTSISYQGALKKNHDSSHVNKAVDGLILLCDNTCTWYCPAMIIPTVQLWHLVHAATCTVYSNSRAVWSCTMGFNFMHTCSETFHTTIFKPSVVGHV